MTTPQHASLAALALTLATLAGTACTSSADTKVVAPAPSQAASSSTPEASTSAAASPATPAAPAATNSASPSAPVAEAAGITIKDFEYKAVGTATPGALVSVTNNDAEAHTVTGDNPSTINVTILPGKTVTFAAPDKAGAFKFHCNFHGNMRGELEVG